jgi:conjugative relaxase-like TrwC/TraI family protein
VAVVATLSKGYDLDYVWRQVGASTVKDPAGYYIHAAEAGGEPPGRWWGPGASALGFERGQVVARGPYDLLFGERKGPDGRPLGRPPPSGRKAVDLLRQLLAAEPHATAERKRELQVEAAGRARLSPLYFDLTLSFSKSISIFHASLGENARLAWQARDAAGEAYWSGLVAEVDAMIWQAVHAGFGYFQREAGYARTGSHAARVDGRETGQWHEADLVVAHWLQHVSRDGDMQLHVHSQIAHVARTGEDGKWRAPDSLGYNEHVGAVGAIVSQHLEEALTRRFGLEWVRRDDGHGFEIKGISGQMMRLFSSRRKSITADLRARARAFDARHGRKPSQRELAHLAQASNFATRAAKQDGAIDFDGLHAAWSARLSRALGTRLASVAPSVWGDGGQARASADGAPPSGPGLRPLALARAAQKALALAQDARSTWTRADLIRYLGRVLPRTGMDPDAAARLVEYLADRAVAGEFEPVVCLDAPEAAAVPADLLRADGRSVYQRHGGVRYATRVQLAVEERLLAQAQARSAPGMTREQAARALGASLTHLDAALTRHARDAHADARGGLREDQAAALYAALTDDRRVSVINAPAGSGKTRVLAEAARAWARAGLGTAVGITPSQSARNTLAAWVPESYNTARYLGHLPGRRGARGPVGIPRGTLLLIDEGSMISTRDLADIIRHAACRDAKVILAGDTGQLQAVENGGAMTMVANTLGYVQLAEPVRFTEQWERDASLRLRAGDTSVLAAYDEHGRIIGGEPEQLLEAAAQAYVAHALDGTDVLLMAADHARRRELSRRIRDDLIHLGLVTPGPAVRIADGTRASAGDLIVCTSNDHSTEAGEPGRMLANGDLLRIEQVTPRGPLVRRALDADQETGRRRWTERCFLYSGYADCEIGYAVTDHVAQSRTVHTGLALITGTEDRQHAYVALSRGTHANLAYVFTQSPRTADPKPGTRPAPELGRHDRLARQRDGQPARASISGQASGQAVGVLAQVIARDGQELSATETLTRNLANADHLAILHAMWQGEVTPAREQHYRDLLEAALPRACRGETSHKARWLWRTLRSAELAGLDPSEVIRTAVGQRSLSDARDVAAVVDARIQQRFGALIPLPARPWSVQIPAFADPERQRFAADLAALMDGRTERIGEHAADQAVSWAVAALGPVPGHPLDRLDWQRRASAIGAYRELCGFDYPDDPIGPEPAGDAPDKRAAWHAARAALRLADGPDLRGLPDGALLHMRDTYPVETAWAPRWAGDQLRQVRRGAADARLAAIRACAEAAAATRNGHAGAAARHGALADSYQAIERAYRDREQLLAGVMADRADWEAATASQRRLAVAADAELRRRHPGQNFEPLRSGEPAPVTDADASDLNLRPGQPIPEAASWLEQLAAARKGFAEQLAERRSMTIPQEDPHGGNLGQAFTVLPAASRGAILQPPRPLIPPSTRVLELARQRETEIEAAS